MTEKQIGFLYKAATSLSPIVKNNNHLLLLRSYYLMRCKEITRGYGLPQQQFSIKNRCSRCCLEWTKHTETKVTPLKLSKRQKRRIKQKKNNEDLLHSNKLEQICSFCKHHNMILMLKPKKEMKNVIKEDLNNSHRPSKNILENPIICQPVQIKKASLNVYSKTREVFSLKNKDNTLSSTIKVNPKIIKNNKKKKDKFAGLCQRAVLASAKLKEKKNLIYSLYSLNHHHKKLQN